MAVRLLSGNPDNGVVNLNDKVNPLVPGGNKKVTLT